MAFQEIGSNSIALVVAAIVIAVGALTVNGMATGLPIQNVDSTAWNITQYGLGGLQSFSSWFGTIVLIVVGVLLLTLVIRGFSGRMQ